MEKHKKITLISKGFLLILFLAGVTFLTIKFAPNVTSLVRNLDGFQDLLASFGPTGVLVFIFFQILQVVIAVIPGELTQLAGGYIYGTFWGTVYSTLGIFLGAVIVFFIARILGFPVLKVLIPQKELEKFNFVINSPKSEITMFILFLIPGIPKDFLAYIAGVTPIRPVNFFTIFLIARFPGLLGSSYIGENIQEKNYLVAIIVSTIACALFLIGFLKKDLIVNKLHHAFNKDHTKNEP